MKRSTPLDSRSRKLRLNILQYIRRGHLGSAFSLIEILRTLYDHVLKFNPKNPRWADRDRFILSKGHGSLALYAILSDKKFFPQSELARFCKHDGILGGHPQYGKVPGVEASTGSLGHGLAIGIGIALAGRIDKKSYRTYVVLGDGECDEGSVWEAALHAGKHQLDSLTIFVDYNKMQSYGPIKEVLDLEPLGAKWSAFGFHTQEVDGHNVKQILKAIKTAQKLKGKPHAIICHTVKGKGIASIEGNRMWHHKNAIGDEEIESFIKELKGN